MDGWQLRRLAYYSTASKFHERSSAITRCIKKSSESQEESKILWKIDGNIMEQNIRKFQDEMGKYQKHDSFNLFTHLDRFEQKKHFLRPNSISISLIECRASKQAIKDSCQAKSSFCEPEIWNKRKKLKQLFVFILFLVVFFFNLRFNPFELVYVSHTHTVCLLVCSSFFWKMCWSKKLHNTAQTARNHTHFDAARTHSATSNRHKHIKNKYMKLWKSCAAWVYYSPRSQCTVIISSAALFMFPRPNGFLACQATAERITNQSVNLMSQF